MSSEKQEVRYEADEKLPLSLTIGLGLQYTALNLTSVVIKPVILVSIAGGTNAYLNWAVFMSLIVSGIATAIQAIRIGHIGAGYILVMGSTSAFLAVSASAIQLGGADLLATLIIASSVVQFILAANMALLRRIFTPTVAGTVLMLIPVTLAPIVSDTMMKVPEGTSEYAAPVTALLTLFVTLFMTLRFTGVWRLWALGIGLVLGSLVGAAFGIYDVERVAAAPWIGLPDFSGYPGMDLSFGPAFWALLPGFIIVTLVGAMDTLGDTMAVQRLSWRKPRAIDFRSVQGAINADGLGNLLSGLGGTVPNTTYGKSIAVVEITGVAARTIGVCVGIMFGMLAFLPKIVAVVVAIPSPVAGAYMAISISLLFIFGLKILINDGLDYRKSLIVGFSFWVGMSFQFELMFPFLMQGAFGEVMGHGMTAGGVAVVFLSLLLDLTSRKPMKFRTRLSYDSVLKVDTFLCEFSSKLKLDEQMTERVRASGEEALHIIRDGGSRRDRNLLLIAKVENNVVILEIIAGASDFNIENQLAVLTEGVAELPNESEAPLRLLRHYATSVKHQQYHGTDIATIRLEPQTSQGGS